MDFGETQYAGVGDVDIAYRVFGDGPLNVVIVPGIFSHLDLFFTVDIFCAFMDDSAGSPASPRSASAAPACPTRLGPLDRARVRLAQRNPRTSRAISRLIMRGADDSLTPR